MSLQGSDQALMYALGGVMRGGASRGGYISAGLAFTIGGVFIGASDDPTAPHVLLRSLTVHDALNELPNTATFTLRGTPPAEGAEVIIAFQSINNSQRLFAGPIIKSTLTYAAANPVHVLTHVECCDYTWQLNRLVITARYRNQSATAIVQDLVARYAPGYTTAGVAPGLPTIDEITMTDTYLMDAIAQVAQRIGGYAVCDYRRDVHLWVDADVTYAPDPAPLTRGGARFSDFSYARDLSQIVTRALIEGGGVNARAAVEPGSTLLPIDDSAWYDPAGGYVVSGPQRLSYTGVTAGGGGSLVGPAVQPTTAPTLALAVGGAVPPGAHGYAYTFKTATGQSLPSPVGTITTAATLAAPTVAPTVVNDDVMASGGGAVDERQAYAWRPGDRVDWAYSYGTAPGGGGVRPFDPTTTRLSPLATITAIASQYYYWVPGQSAQAMRVYTTPSSDPNVRSIFVWHRVNGGQWLQWTPNQNLPDATSAGAARTQPAVYSVPGPAPTSNPQITTVTLSQISLGPTGTTGRTLYRTAANAAPLLTLATLADNTTTTYTDAAADSALGGLAPTSDTSGLKVETGQVLAGATTLPMANTLIMATPPAYAVLGNGEQTIRYSGKTATALTGIPATGPGAIVATVNYGSSITAAAMLTGIPASGTGAIAWPILEGDPVNLLVVLNDVPGQTQLAALIGGDGVQERKLTDRRISRIEARARAQALLALRQAVVETVNYRVRDRATRTGRPVTVDLEAPWTVAGTYQIQDVQISQFQPHTWPAWQVTASSARYTFEDLVRRARTTGS